MSYPKNALILENVKDMLVILVASEEKFEAIPGEVKQLGNMPSKAGTWNEIEVVFQLWKGDSDEQ